MKFRSKILVCVQSVLLASLLSGCILEKDLSGFSFMRSDSDATYVFDKENATFGMTMDHALIETDVQGYGKQAMMITAEDLDNRSVLHVIAGDRMSYRSRLFLFPYEQSFTCDMNGQLSYSGGSTAQEIYGEFLYSALPQSDLLSLCFSAKNEKWFHAYFVDASGESSTDEAALDNIAKMFRESTGGQFYMVFADTPRVAYCQGDWVEVATVPVEYSKSTVTLKWYDATYSGLITGKMRDLFIAWLEPDDKTIFRVEDDDRFLFNPETSSRWKRQ